MYRFILATRGHAIELADNIHPGVEKEIKTMSEKETVDIVIQSLEKSDEAWSVFDEEGLICIFGISSVSILSDRAVPWFLTTKLIDKHKKTLLYLTKIGLTYWLGKYSTLENYVPQEYTKAIRWLRWAGFTILPAQPIGIGGVLIHKIEMKRV